MKKTLIAVFLVMGSILQVYAQVGGMNTYQFLALQPNARIAALGGNAIATYTNDLNLAVQNPALLRKDMHNQVVYNHVFYFADIQAGYVAYARHIDSLGTFSGGLQYVNYGSFKKTNANGEVLGSFTAGEYAFNMAYARALSENLSIGGQIKFIYSSLEEYNSYGVAIDAGATYYMPEELWTFSAVISNVGRQIKTYTANNNEDLPFNLQVGASKKLKNAPFRFSVIASHLEKPGMILYTNLEKPSLQKDLETGQTIPETFGIGDRILSHVNASAEVLLGKTFYVALGYNHLRRWEMKLRDVGGFTGYSWGFGLKISKFQFAYGSSTYLVGRSTDHLSFIVNLNDFRKKKS